MLWVQAVGMAVVWETLSKGTRFWGADKATNLLCAFQLSQGWPWLCPLVSEDQRSWSMGAGQTALGKHPSASWALSQGRMAGVSKMCAHKSISVCVYEHRHKHMYMCVYIYIYICILPFRLPGTQRLSERDSPHGRMSPKPSDFRPLKLLLIFTAGGENSIWLNTLCIFTEINFWELHGEPTLMQRCDNVIQQSSGSFPPAQLQHGQAELWVM